MQSSFKKKKTILIQLRSVQDELFAFKIAAATTKQTLRVKLLCLYAWEVDDDKKCKPLLANQFQSSSYGALYNCWMYSLFLKFFQCPR